MSWQQLDKRTIFVAPLMPLVSVIGVVTVIVLVRGWEKVGFWEPAITGVIAVGLFVANAWHWKTTRYRITDTHVELHSGMIVRKHRSLAKDRVRAVDMSADVFHRMFGLSVVTIGTGRHVAESDDELKLEAVSAREAERLRALLLHRAGTPVQPRQRDGMLAKFSPQWIRYAPFSWLGFVAVAVLGGGLFQLARTIDLDLWNTGPMQTLFRWYETTPLLVSILATFVVVMVLTTVLSVLLYAVFYWDFQLTRQHGALRVQYGLINKRSVSIEDKRLRGAVVEEPLLVRLTGGAKVKAVATGLNKKKDDNDKWEMDADLLLPQAPKEDARKVVASVLSAERAPTDVALSKHPFAAARWMVLSTVAVAAVPAVTLGVLSVLGLTPWWIAQLLLILIPLGALLGYGEYRSLGHGLDGDFLVVRWGVLPRSTVALQRTGVIGWKIRQSFLQRRTGLISVTATIAAGSGAYTIRYADQGDALDVADTAVPGLLEPFLTRD
ncbi:PH domain-containing protein [Kibdelosporangium persicum]|uniref:Transmembrane protein, distant-likey with ydbT n=1 Tax=Kibdelosporangium persicum TaxID=2698649 RepID=A0ABX2FA52_9PSEU|nr:PH domain-containing protein [Kibdelosporangium persicum]NRN67786.1 Transmembrane protein, distant-likey with ydbT [Kibdelosporangium persicum]